MSLNYDILSKNWQNNYDKKSKLTSQNYNNWKKDHDSILWDEVLKLWLKYQIWDKKNDKWSLKTIMAKKKKKNLNHDIPSNLWDKKSKLWLSVS